MSVLVLHGESGVTAPTVEDRDWFEREVVGVLPDLYGTALRLTRNATDAEDLAADAVAKAWFCFGSLRDRSSFRGWLFRILMNLYISNCRARATRPSAESLEDPDSEDEPFSIFERLHQPILLWWGNPEREFLDKLLREDFERAIDGLPETFRAVVIMADLQGMSYREIADVLETPIGTVRSRLARGRSQLQKALWKHALDAGLAQSDPIRTRNTDE